MNVQFTKMEARNKAGEIGAFLKGLTASTNLGIPSEYFIALNQLSKNEFRTSKKVQDDPEQVQNS